LLIAPWFVYAHRRYGSVLWNTIAGEHVYRRFTASLDPGHLQPWYYYFLTVYQRLSDSGVAVLAAGGLGVLAWQVYARRRLDALIVVLWAMIPMVLMSLGTSKLYHYAYPFLPAFALAVGYLVALLFALAPAPVERWVRALHAYAHRRFPRGSRLGKTIPFRMVLVAGIAASLGLAAASIALGQIRVELADGILFRSTGIFRPSMVALLLALPLGLGPRARRVVLPLVIVSFLPLPAYRASLVALTREDHPYRSTIECISRVDEGLPGGPRGLYVAWPHHETWHPVNYYFRRVQPWEYDSVADAAKVAKSAGAAGLRPVLIWRSEYQKLPASLRAELATHVDLNQKGYLILPGPYGVCDAGPIFR
jgi:hypothetical protein